MGTTKRLLIFAGVGASMGVSYKKFPATLEFRRQLPDGVKSNSLFKAIDLYLNKKSQPTTTEENDIEKILWVAKELRDVCGQASRVSGPLGWMLEQGRFSSVLQANNADQNTRALLDNMLRETETLESNINKELYKFYNQEPTSEELNTSWLPVLDWAIDNFSRMDVFTTNYDKVLEHAVADSKARGKIDLGYRNNKTGASIINTDLWAKNTKQSNGQKGLLTKLHGSINWHYNGQSKNEVVIGFDSFRGDHDSRAILYPGFKGYALDEPFKTFHDYLDNGLTEADAMLFIGFAFRDENINDLISLGNENAKTVVWNPEETPFPNNDTQPFNFTNKFGAEGVDWEPVKRYLLGT